MKQTIFSISMLCFLLGSCKNDKPIAEVTKPQPKVAKENPNPPQIQNDIQEYIPEGFEIQYECDGDLNQDGLKDYAYVLRNIEEDTWARKTLVFLGDKEKGRQLFQQSEQVFPVEYSDEGYKIYDSETISIEENQLMMELSGLGPSGTTTIIFQFENGGLFLKSLESFHAGAGGQTIASYEVMTGKIEMTQVNTMKEDMPSETEVKNFAPLKLAFEKVNPMELFDQQILKFGF
ncbi:hypothetical protein [Flavobacterium columnare]|uniref:hypothetical protein n=1 Tax=Flavobacterium columnare TaxID=996 RepID=UPI003BA15C60